jgi:hypothetical protein
MEACQRSGTVWSVSAVRRYFYQEVVHKRMAGLKARGKGLYLTTQAVEVSWAEGRLGTCRRGLAEDASRAVKMAFPLTVGAKCGGFACWATVLTLVAA